MNFTSIKNVLRPSLALSEALVELRHARDSRDRLESDLAVARETIEELRRELRYAGQNNDELRAGRDYLKKCYLSTLGQGVNARISPLKQEVIDAAVAMNGALARLDPLLESLQLLAGDDQE